MTKFSFDILDAETHEWESVALFSDIIPNEVLIDMAWALWNDVDGAADLAIMNMETGEIVWNAADAQEYDYEPADIDDDCGFDPYMGCYSDDC